MPKMHVSRSATIAAPIDKIYTTLNDFNNWRAWSPWLIQEPEAKVTVADDSKSYGWEGNRIGAGEMKITSEEEKKSINYDLTFLKPWKSHAKVRFEFAEKDGGVEVTWLMDSSLPIFMFWMKKMFEGFIGMDYERGLNMLKELMETGNVSSKVDIKGSTMFPGCKYVGVTTSCAMDEIGPKMEQDLAGLGKWAADNAEIVAQPFTVYHKWDMVKKRVEYTSAIPVKEFPANLPSQYKKGELAEMHTYCVSHTGNYEHLGNAWSTGMNLQQNKAFKSSKKQHPFEVYVSDPVEVAPKDIVTEIHFPIK